MTTWPFTCRAQLLPISETSPPTQRVFPDLRNSGYFSIWNKALKQRKKTRRQVPKLITMHFG